MTIMLSGTASTQIRASRMYATWNTSTAIICNEVRQKINSPDPSEIQRPMTAKTEHCHQMIGSNYSQEEANSARLSSVTKLKRESYQYSV